MVSEQVRAKGLRVIFPHHSEIAKRVSKHDMVVVVGEDGTEIDISHLVRSIGVDHTVGSVEILNLGLLGYNVELAHPDDATSD